MAVNTFISFVCPTCLHQAGHHLSDYRKIDDGRVWSDGWSVRANGQGLLECPNCGSVFSDRSADFLESECPGIEVFNVLDPSYPVANDGQLLGRSPRVILLQGTYICGLTERMLRRQWWWDWNDTNRNATPTLSEAVAMGSCSSAAMPLDLSDNLVTLLALLDPRCDQLEIGEIFRQLGRFNAAASYLGNVIDEMPLWIIGMLSLCRQGKSALVELPGS